MKQLVFVLGQHSDPELRLEEAALWKALHDVFGERIKPIVNVNHEEVPPSEAIVLGTAYRYKDYNNNLSSHDLPYWTDPAFLALAQRSFVSLPYEKAEVAVAELHARGWDAFVKSTRSKHYITKVLRGTTLGEALDEMVYSFCDGGPQLMVQPLVQVTYETRFFCFNRQIVTYSPVQWQLTPLDTHQILSSGYLFRTPASKQPEDAPMTLVQLSNVAKEMAGAMRTQHAVIDCGLIDGVPGVIELNPLRLGECGLFAADVRKLAVATRAVIDNERFVV